MVFEKGIYAKTWSEVKLNFICEQPRFKLKQKQ